ncbi:Hypothetical protein CAP_8865 [Chondromyces apiculatus DSM 436]|uniref:Uncharacterized protein n=2 Tax=Chondromyces apiculatus TaxID=51 RepID=A0A017SVW9_9BACT|nr:Hypothetical protein CAP_8865 [Chondromyces apiculatus DSM 436]
MPDAARPCYALLASMSDRSAAYFLALALGAAAVTTLLPSACSSSAPNPFATGGGGGAGGQGGQDGGGGEGEGLDPTLGGPCVDDGQCDDGIPCTVDTCDKTLDRCRFAPDDMSCQNAVYCDGVERCAPKFGCRAGEPVDCGDANACTIDACVEETRQCTHEARDADQDGDPDAHCGGGDCDDADPSASSAHPELCGNGRDDDCDGVVDEAMCSSPANDTCVSALEITQPGSYAMSTIGAAFDYATACSPAAQPPLNDVVAAIVLPAGPPVDVEVTARTPYVGVAVTLAGQCGDAASAIACGGPHPAPFGKIAKLRGRGLGSTSQTTAMPLYVTTAGGTQVTLDVAFLPPTPPPTHETCGTATPLAAGVPVEAEILDAEKDLGSACETALGDLVYTFELTEPQDVHVYATSLDGDGSPSISLRNAACALPEDEITCQTANPAHLFRHELQPGTYFVGVSASAPTTVVLTLELDPPTAPPPDETCAGAPPLPINQSVPISLSAHQDDIQVGCLAGAPDAAHALDLTVSSDVLLVERISQGDTGAIALLAPACEAPSDRLACYASAISPVRTAKYNVPAGDYRVVAETLFAQPVEVTALVRPASPPTLVVFADGCSDALEIPSTGGRFQGTTANASADFGAGCDQTGTLPGGAADQLLKLVLPARKRVVLDMAGSGYTTLLNVRAGPACPGAEIPFACTIGTGQGSFLDLVLDPGTYYLQIDGLSSSEGPWFLDVHVVDPPP